MSSFNGSGVPSPAPSNASNNSAIKRKRDFSAAPRKTAVELVREQEARPRSTLAQVQLATERLKGAKEGELTFDVLINYLSIQHADPAELMKLRNVMQAGRHSKIEYRPKGAGGKGTFAYKPLIPVKDVESMRGYLQARPSALGVKVDDIKDGWATCTEELESMQGRGEVLLVRGGNKLKGQEQPKAVWHNDPTLCHYVVDELKKAWEGIPIPVMEDTLRDKLQAAGLKPTTAPRGPVLPTAAKKKPRKARQSNKGTSTNTSVPLKDYSHLRK